MPPPARPQTVYKLDLPNANRTTLDDSVRLFSGSDPRTGAVGGKSSGGRADRAGGTARAGGAAAAHGRSHAPSTFFAGNCWPSAVRSAPWKRCRRPRRGRCSAFHRRWYRPENAVVVLVGDADPRLLAVIVEQHFADWQGNGRVPYPRPISAIRPRRAGPIRPIPVGRSTVIVRGRAAARRDLCGDAPVGAGGRQSGIQPRLAAR